MSLRSLAWLFPLAACLAMAQVPARIDCNRNPTLCQIDIGGQTLTMGMPKDRAVELLARSSYHLSEDRVWSAEHKPDSLWHLNVAEHQPFAGAIKGGVSSRVRN